MWLYSRTALQPCSAAPFLGSSDSLTRPLSGIMHGMRERDVRVGQLAAHLSGCFDLNQNFCRSAIVSQAKPTRKAAPAAYPSGPKALAGTSVCKPLAAVRSRRRTRKALGTLPKVQRGLQSVYMPAVGTGEKHGCLPGLL